MQRKHSYHKKTPQTENGVFLEEEGPTSKVSYGCNKRRMELPATHLADGIRAHVNWLLTEK